MFGCNRFFAPVPAEVVLVVVKGVASSQRVETEVTAIRSVMRRRSDVRILEIDSSELTSTLQRECDGISRVWVHLVGHHCSTSPEGEECEEILHLEAESAHKFALKRKLVSRLCFTFADMVNELKNRQGIELVFFNASKTKALADSLDMYTFGWSTVCLDQGAVAFAAAFYDAVARPSTFVDAFQAACQQLKRCSTLSVGRSRVNCGPLTLVDPKRLLKKRKREYKLEAGIIAGLGKTKIIKLAHLGISTLQQLARAVDSDLVQGGACKSARTVARWRDAANSIIGERSRDSSHSRPLSPSPTTAEATPTQTAAAS